MKTLITFVLLTFTCFFLGCENHNSSDQSTPVNDEFFLPDSYYRWDHAEGSFTQYALDIDNPSRYWNETSNNGIFDYLEVSRDNNTGEIVLMDLNRENVYIKLTPNQCFYKGSDSEEWRLIYENSNGWIVDISEIPFPHYIPESENDNISSENSYSDNSTTNDDNTNAQSSKNTNNQKKCTTCNGTKIENCYNCKGTGQDWCNRCKGEGCEKCNFSGKLECNSCVGKGQISCTNCSWLIPL
jgi:hypothetical protein